MSKKDNISKEIHKNCMVYKGHHFSRTYPDFKCLVCGNTYMESLDLDPWDIGECNGSKEHSSKDESTRTANEESQGSTEGVGGSEASDSSRDEDEEESEIRICMGCARCEACCILDEECNHVS